MSHDEWFCIMRSQDLADIPLQREVLGEKVVIFRDGLQRISVLVDVCPHRGAALSKGSIHDGRLECLYHGWQFSGDGRCQRIHTLSKDAPIPGGAHAQRCLSLEVDGYLWMSYSASSAPEPSYIMEMEKFGNDSQYRMLHAQADIDAHYKLVLENFLCPTHVFFTHENMAPFMNREHCGPFETTVVENSFGFMGQVFHPKLGVHSTYEFRYPGMLEVSQKSPYGSTVQQFYVTPISEKRTRLFARGYYPNSSPDFEQAAKRFFEIIEQDVYLMPTLQDNEDRGHTLWNAPTVADRLPLFARRYMDARPLKFGARRFHRGKFNEPNNLARRDGQPNFNSV